LVKIIKAAGDGGVTLERRTYVNGVSIAVEEKMDFRPEVISKAHEGACKYIEDITQTENADHRMVALYLNRLDRDHHNATGRSPERGTIESISPKSLPVHWISEMDSIQIKSIGGANLFDLVFTVDVKVETARGKPVSYRVLKLHGWEPLNGEEEPELPCDPLT
jgi:hypothetical protein